MSLVADIATLAHGYTMGDVDRIAKHADNANRRARAVMDSKDRYEAAWHGVVLKLYEEDTVEAPEYWELLYAGMNAIDAESSAQFSNHGMAAAGGVAPRFGAYWLPARGGDLDFTDALTEKMALPALLSVLTDGEYEAISALAAIGDMSDAADILEISYSAFSQRIAAARKKMLKSWYAPETAPTKKYDKNGASCTSGHLRAEHGILKANGYWMCSLCNRNSHRRRRANGEDRSDMAYGLEDAVDAA